MKHGMTTLKLYGTYVFPQVAKVIEVDSYHVDIDSLKQAMQKNALVFLLTYDIINDGLEEKNNEIGMIVRIINIEEKGRTYAVTVFGVNRALIHSFDSQEHAVTKWARINYEWEDLEDLKIAYQGVLKALKEYALFMNSLSAYRVYEQHKEYQIDKIDRIFDMNQLINKLTMGILDETNTFPEEYQQYLENNRLIVNSKHLHRRLYAAMVEEYNQRYNFPEYENTIPAVDRYLEDESEVSVNENEVEEEMTATEDVIQHEVDEELDELEKLELQMIEKGIPKDKLGTFQEEIALLRREDENSKTRLNGIRYLQTAANLPWSLERQERHIKEAKKILDISHYGMEDAKKEIIKFLAERFLNKDAKGAVLCLSGPPGVGKTSLIKTVAKATNQEFIQIKLGGVSDEGIIRGFSRTYAGSAPGIFIKEMEKIDSMNPVILLDEIDKVGANANRGDVSSALLEVLDPSQNDAFRDNYLGIPYDLSKPLYIATANYLDQIPPALKDRMEIVHLEGYTPEEKLKIVQDYILAPILKEGWLKDYAIQIDEDALKKLIDVFSDEPGMRSVERSVLGMCREIALKIMMEDQTTFHLTADNIQEYTNKVNEQELETVKQNIGFLQ